MEPLSFTDLLDAWWRERPPECLYDESTDFAEWQAVFRDKIASLRSRLPDRVEPAPEVVETAEEPDHYRHTLRIPVSRISTLPAYLLVPKDISPGEKRAGLVMQHGHAAYGIDSMAGTRGMDEGDGERRAYGLAAVRSGFVVICPALWGWAGRDGHLGFVREGNDKCNQIMLAAGMYGLNPVDLHIQDLQAALDVLAARDEVDPERLGCAGNSTGGRMTMWLTVYDERVKACVPSGCMNHFRERSLKLTSCGIQYPFGLLRYGDVPEVFSLIAPRPMQLQCGLRDGLITPADRDHIERTVRTAYRKLGAEENLDYQLFDDIHIMHWHRADAFFKKHL